VPFGDHTTKTTAGKIATKKKIEDDEWVTRGENRVFKEARLQLYGAGHATDVV
jgi:hypothetical protein